MDKVGIIDYGCGNLTSIASAVKRLRIDYIVSGEISELKDCSKFILPGVGAFPYAMRVLKERHLEEFIKEKAKNNFPILGVCLGMQLLYESSEEFGGCAGIGILKGHVSKLPDDFPTLPNTGWWSLETQSADNRFGLTKDDTFYFVHSFRCNPVNSEIQINIKIDKFEICAMVMHGSITAVQFHPEKSQKSGEKILCEFLKG